MRVISKEDLANLPIRRYEGKVSLVESARELAQAREDLRQERVVGFDTETRPSFRKGEVHLPCLVQAATAQAVYLFQLSRLDVFPALVELLAKPQVVKAASLSGADNILFRRNSVSGAIEAVPWKGEGIALNAALHAN